MAKNRQLQANEIVWVDPILRCLSNESALISSGGSVALDGMTTGSDEVIEFGEFNDDSVIVVLVKRSFLEVSLDEGGLQGSVRPFLWQGRQQL